MSSDPITPESPRLCACGCGTPVADYRARYVGLHYIPNIAERLAAKVSFAEGDNCHYFTGSTRNGYGEIYYNGKRHYAHRVAWELVNGPIPKGQLVCHRCDNPLCCRVSHMFLGSITDNINDMWRKGRGKNAPFERGEKQWNSKMVPDQVRDIRNKATTQSQASIAREYGMSTPGINAIVLRRSWKHIE